MTFEYILREHGFTDSEIDLNFDVAFNLMTGAFEAGTAITARCSSRRPPNIRLRARVISLRPSAKQAAKSPTRATSAKRSWLDKNEETAKGFLRALLKGVKYAQTEDATVIAEHLVAHFPSTSVQSLATSVESYRNIDAWVSDMAMTEESFERLQDIIESAGELDRPRRTFMPSRTIPTSGKSTPP